MKRRYFCRYLVLGSACFTNALVHNYRTARAINSPAKSYHQWVVLYWMPYDNDLVRFGEPIVEMLTHGTQNSDVAVVVQSDYRGDATLRRRQLINGNISEIEVTEEDSSNSSVFSAYLDWAKQTFEAEHWAIIVVGHGGKINEISPDDHSTTDRGRTWMGVNQFAHAVHQFNLAINGNVELLFFQNCNKATLEVIYEVRNCARYTLASQLTLGAPNYYYEGFLNSLKDPTIKGYEAALAIMNAERADMYHTLTLVNNQAVNQIPDKLSPLIQTIVNHDLPEITKAELLTDGYFGEQHCDILTLLDTLSKASNQGRKAFNQFADFLRSSVIASYKTGGELLLSPPESNFNLEKFCGLSLYLPETEQAISRYRSLALYQKLDLVRFYTQILRQIKD